MFTLTGKRGRLKLKQTNKNKQQVRRLTARERESRLYASPVPLRKYDNDSLSGFHMLSQTSNWMKELIEVTTKTE